jgi:hypothetical protein
MAHQQKHSTVTETVGAVLVSEATRPPVSAEFRYRTWDPFAVQLVLALDQSPAVLWEFARDLVVTGRHVPVGLGDVRVFPAPDGLRIELHGCSSVAVLSLDRRDVERFVQRALTAVPVDGESDYYQLDDEVTLLVSLPVPDAREA